MTTAAATTRRPGANDGAATQIIVGIILLLGVGLLLVLSVFWFGHVVGVEFSPDKFTYRAFYYYQIPLVGLQVSPVYRKDATDDLSSYLKKKQLIPRSDQDKPRWHLVRAVETGRTFAGDAEILHMYLGMERDGTSRWLAWSKKNPKLAAVLWPVVTVAAREHLYAVVPELFELATDAGAAGTLEKALNERMAETFREHAANYQQLGNYSRALRYFEKSLEYEPASAAAIKGRDECRAARKPVEDTD